MAVMSVNILTRSQLASESQWTELAGVSWVIFGANDVVVVVKPGSSCWLSGSANGDERWVVSQQDWITAECCLSFSDHTMDVSVTGRLGNLDARYSTILRPQPGLLNGGSATAMNWVWRFRRPFDSGTDPWGAKACEMMCLVLPPGHGEAAAEIAASGLRTNKITEHSLLILLEKRVKARTKLLEASNSSLTGAKSNIRDLESKLRDRVNRMQASEEANARAEIAKAKAEAKAQQSHLRAEEDARRMNERIANLEAEKRLREERVEKLDAENVEREERIAKLQAGMKLRDEKVSNLERDMEIRDQKLSGLEAEKRLREERIANLEAEKRRLDDSVAKLDAEKMAWDQRISELHAGMKRRDEEVSNLKRDLVIRDQNLSGLEAEKRLRDEKVSNLEVQLEAEKRLREDSIQEMRNVLAQSEDLSAIKVADADVRHKKAQAELLEGSNALVDKWRSRAHELQRELTEVLDELKSKERLPPFGDANQADQLDSERLELNELRIEVEQQYHVKEMGLRAELTGKDQELVKYEQKLAEFSKSETLLMGKLREAEVEAAKLRDKIRDLEANVVTIMETGEKKATTVESSSKLIESLKLTISEKERHLETANAHIESLRRDFNMLCKKTGYVNYLDEHRRYEPAPSNSAHVDLEDELIHRRMEVEELHKRILELGRSR